MTLSNSDEAFDCPMEPPPNALPPPQAEILSSVPESLPADDETGAWRDEVAQRLNRYRARRKAPPARYPSLKLPFGPHEPLARASTPEVQAFEPILSQALAIEIPASPSLVANEADAMTVPEPAPRRITAAISPGAKIIEFPRFSWGPPAPPPDQLAEPVVDRPRILEVPEEAPPPPALGGITIERVENREETGKRLGVDVPLQAAPIGLRLIATAIDGLIVAIASAVFGVIFWKVAAIQPPRLQVIALAGGVPSIFWAAYQYLLIVFSGSTPGLRVAHLELSRFDGSGTKRSSRRWRVLASYLSAASLGMGYVWVLLDEDALCWHDRITRTYLAPMKPIRNS